MAIDAINAFNPFQKKINPINTNYQQPETKVGGVESQGAQSINFGQLTRANGNESIAPTNAKANYENGLAPGNQAGMTVSHNGQEGVAGKALYLIG